MATKKVIFFTAGTTATAGEIADIAKLNAAAEAQYEVIVANGAANAQYGETDRIIPSDFVAGTVPTKYNAVDVIDPDAIPNQALLPTQAIVSDTQAFTTEVSGVFATTATVTVVDNVVTAIVLS